MRQPTFNYKPLILRTIPLLSLLALTLALVGLLEYAHVRLPRGEVNLKRRDEAVFHKQINNIGRRSASSLSVSSSGANSSSSSLIPVPAYTTAESAYVDDKSTSTIVLTPSTDTSAFVVGKETTTISDPPQVSVFAADPTAYVPEHSTSSMATTVQMDTAVSAFVPGTTVETITHKALFGATMPPTAASAATSAYVPPGSTVLRGPGSNNGHQPANGQDETDDGAYNEANDDNDNNDNTSFKGQGASVDDEGSGTQVVVVQVWSPEQIFLGNYLAVCVAVIYRLVWVVLYNAFNLMEPFRQLMSREGATAEYAFFAFYQSQSNLLGPIPALVGKRWALGLVASAYLIVNLLPALASESVFVDTDWACKNPKVGSNNPCNPRITANTAILRTIQGLLGFCAVVILFATSLLLFNRTGLPTKPNSIASVASLMRHPQLMADISDLPVNASPEQLQRLMAGKRYRMGHYTCANGLAGYGIQPWTGYEPDGYAAQSGASRHQYTPVDGSLPFSVQEDSKVHRLQIKDFILGIFLLGAFGVVLAYYLDGGKNGFNGFFNSNTFGPRFILTLAATVIASIWKSVEQGEHFHITYSESELTGRIDAIVMAPYIRLHKRPSSPSSTILMTSTSTPISSTIRTLRNRYFLASAITMMTLAAEGLNVVISGIPYANGQRRIEFVVSTYMSIAILGVMIIVTVIIIILRLLEPKIPRKPTTLGAVMSYLCSSRMLDDFEGVECLDEQTRDRRVRSWLKKYEFTETVRRDGKLAWTVDDAFDQPRF